MVITESKKIVVCVAAIISLFFFLHLSAHGATVRATPFAVKGFTSGAKISIDKMFEQKHGMAVPAPFSFLVPRFAGIKVYAEYPEGKGSEYVKLSFATNERKLLENLRFVPMQISMSTTQARMQAAARVLVQQGFPMAVKGYLQPKMLTKRITRVGPYNAVEVTGQYEDKTIGRLFVRLVAIINPASRHCLLSFSNAVKNFSQVKKAADIGKKGITANIINTVRFKGK